MLKYLLLFSLVMHSAISAEKPNIIFILADDLGYADVGFNGQKYIKTPCLDKMRSEGMSLTQHYSGSTVCAPSRSVLMTGQHTGRTRVRGNGPGNLHDEDLTVAEIAKQAGYTTACIGKWGLGQFDTEGSPLKQGFDHFFGFIDQSRAHHYYQNHLWRNEQKVLYKDNKQKRTHYAHDEFTKEAFSFIESNAENPFFLYLAYTIPHVDLDVPAESVEPYLHLPEKGPFKGSSYMACEKPRATFAGMVSHLDKDVGRLLDLLKKLNIDQKTLVIFTSDNGPTNAGGADPAFFNGNGDFRGVKRDLYEGGLRMPFVAWWPGKIAANSTSKHISAFWDFMPTCADIFGLKKPEETDGLSYLPTLMGLADQQQHQYLYWEFYEKGGKQAIRQGKWKGIRLNRNGDPEAKMALYNLDIDPGEQQNLADQHPEKVQELLKMMQEANTKSDYHSFTEKKKRKRRRKK